MIIDPERVHGRESQTSDPGRRKYYSIVNEATQVILRNSPACDLGISILVMG